MSLNYVEDSKEAPSAKDKIIVKRNITNKNNCFPIPEDNRILFFRRDRDTFPFLSNFYPASIILDEFNWHSSEQYYQYYKSDEPTFKEAIIATETALEAKIIGATALTSAGIETMTYKHNKRCKRCDNWDDIKLDLMQKVVRAKFEQNPKLMKMLLATNNTLLIEDSEEDYFWGSGADGSGMNQLGKILMTVRQEAR